MEFEQVEYGRRIVMEAITRQDVNAYYGALSPDVLLVTHFPYPTNSSDSNLQGVQHWARLSQQQQQRRRAANAIGSVKASTEGTGASASGRNPNSKRRIKELLQRQEECRARQRKRYEAFRKRREGHHGGDAEDTEKSGTESSQEGEDAQAAAAAGVTQVDGAHGNAPTNTAAANAADATATARRRNLTAKTVTANKASDNASDNSGSGSGGGGSASRVPLGVRWFRQQQQQQQQQANSSIGVPQRMPGAPRKEASTPAQTHSTASPITGSSKTATETPTLGFEDVVDITEGRLLASVRFFELLHFINTEKSITNIAPIEVDLHLRKDILQEDEVLPAPPPPTTVQEQYEQLGIQYTERNQPLSCMSIIWGSDYLLFQDKLYFDDGLIVTIQRTMLPVTEVVARALPVVSWNPQQQQRLSERKGHAGGMPLPTSGKSQGLTAALAEQAYKAVESFYGVSASRVNALNTSWPLLDYSFLEAPEPSALLRLSPASGHVHVSKNPHAATDPRLAQGVFLNESNDTSASAAQAADTRMLIKAKNKRGEEEAYEFNTNRNHYSMLAYGDEQHGDGEEGDEWGPRDGGSANATAGGKGKKGRGVGVGATAVRAQRYDASCVRVSGCHLHTKMDQLVPVLSRLVANSLLTLHTLDLSQNRIAALPDFRLLPLQNLKLHDNAIADWRVVENRIAPLPFLSILTLHGNPIAEEKEAPRPGMVIPATHNHNSTTTKHPMSRAGAASANKAVNATGESAYWKKLLALLLGNPARVVPLRQVDFVTLTAQDLNVAGAHSLFTTGKSDVLDQARAFNTCIPRKDKITRTATTTAGVAE